MSFVKECNWHVAYTYPRSEKKVHLSIQKMGFESFLPITKVKRKWSDRIKWVEIPVFSNYLFVKTTIERIPMLSNIDGIVRFLFFGNKFAIVKEEEINSIKQIIDKGLSFEVEKINFKRDERVEITSGPFTGMRGYIVEEHGKNRFIVAIEGFEQGLSINVPSCYLSS